MTPSPSPDELDVAQAAALPQQSADDAWLVRTLWTRHAVGLISGHPKVGKTWLGLDVAISVASGTPCLGRFPVDDPGPALVYLAEDALPRVRERLASLCALRSLRLDALPLYVITATSLRLDDHADRQRLEATLARLAPRLLVLDPLVRLHSGDENDVRYVSALLGFLRALSRRHHLAIALVHHMSKKNRRQLGQSLRGSSDLWAWADSAAYLTRVKSHVLLSVEHRAAAAPDPLALVLATGPDGSSPHLEPAPDAGAAPSAAVPTTTPPLVERIRQTLREANAPVPRIALRQQLRVNNQRLGDVLQTLEREGHVTHDAAGWQLAGCRPPRPAATPAPSSEAQLCLPAA
jgi:hypothetical protein